MSPRLIKLGCVKLPVDLPLGADLRNHLKRRRFPCCRVGHLNVGFRDGAKYRGNPLGFVRHQLVTRSALLRCVNSKELNNSMTSALLIMRYCFTLPFSTYACCPYCAGFPCRCRGWGTLLSKHGLKPTNENIRRIIVLRRVAGRFT